MDNPDLSNPASPALSPDRYQIVVLDCPYDTWSESRTRELLMRTLTLKINGYGTRYPYGALPVDTSDFVGTHLLVCEKRNSELLPVMGYKSTQVERTSRYGLPFPCVSILQASGAERHLVAANEIIRRCQANGIPLSYDGSWTLDPVLRSDPKSSRTFKEALMAINTLHHLDFKIPETLAFGLLRFKTDQFFQEIGYRPVRFKGETLEPLRMASLQNEPVVLMHLSQFTSRALETAERFRSLWDSRLEISSRQWAHSGMPKAA